MDLKLQSDDSSYDDRPQSGFHLQDYEASDPHSVREDDPEEDTVFIANQYHNDQTSSFSRDDDLTVKRNEILDVVYDILFYAGAGLMAIGYFGVALSVGRLGAGATGLSSLKTMFIMVVLGKLMLIADAFTTSFRTGDHTLLLWIFFFVPVYILRRTSNTGGSMAVAWVIFLLFLSSYGFTVQKLYGSGVDSYYAAYSNDKYSMSDDEIMAALQGDYYSEDGQIYYLSRIITDNITDPEYRGASDKAGDYKNIKVTGTTTLYGKKQKITLNIGFNTGITEIKLGFRTYNGNSRFSEIYHDMINNTTPNVP